MEVVASIHDSFVKSMMEYPEIALDFFSTHLPLEVLDKVDLTTLRHEDATFVDEKLAQTHSDLVFSVKRLNGDSSGYLWVLMEHQSTSDPLMPHRVLHYVMRILRRHVLENNEQPLRLPLVFPIVLFNGIRPWSHSRDFCTLFGDMEDLAREAYLKPLKILDVSALEPEDLRKERLANLMLVSLYRSLSARLNQKFEILAHLCNHFRIHPSSDLGKIVLKYNAFEFELEGSESGARFNDVISQFPINFQEAIMTYREVLVNESEARGAAKTVDKVMHVIEMLGMDLSIDDIAKATELELSFVERLCNGLAH